MSVLDGSIANTALPTIARDLGAAPAESIWIINGFQLAVTASLLAFAALGQLRGPSRVYRAGVIVFVAGSLASALAHSLPLLIAARVFQGLGASAIMAISPALLRDIFPRAQLGRALGLNSFVVATSSAAGPALGGLMLAVLPWPWLFAINVPFGVVNILMNRALPRNERNRGWLDIPSVITSALGFALTVWGLDGFARADPWWTIVLRLGIGITSGIWFVRRQFTLPQPMIALDLFRIPAFSFAGATSFATFTAQGLAFVALPFVFQLALARTPLQSGLLLTSWPLATAIVAPVAGYLADRVAAGILATIGLGVFALGLGLYATMPADPTGADIVLRGIVCGLGFGFFQSPNNRELIGSAPREKSASAAGILAAIRVGGQTAGTAVVAIVFGVFGASATGGAAPHDAVAHAAPAVLWLACASAGVATIASGLRLRTRASASA
ncbi:MAG: transporter, family, multidrug resistance protein [Candidatus Eremiobacteraeota bacterium]|jgi:DHA2 family multidrug resistance protein-like MFS transporter|nr:transporter, family, multidrug resistance protein [Candidatus Eremiobacteraeota bacterium]